LQVDSFLLAPLVVAQTQLVLTAPRSALRAARRVLPVEVVEAPLELRRLAIAAYWDPRRGTDARTRWLVELVARHVGGGEAPG